MARPLHPERFDCAWCPLVDLQAVRKVDDFVLRPVNHQHRRRDSRDLFNTVCVCVRACVCVCVCVFVCIQMISQSIPRIIYCVYTPTQKHYTRVEPLCTGEGLCTQFVLNQKSQKSPTNRRVPIETLLLNTEDTHFWILTTQCVRSKHNSFPFRDMHA